MSDLHYVTTREPWGRLQVVVGGKDVTFFRDAPCVVQDMSFTDPYGPLRCTLWFPQIFVHEELGTGNLDWLTDLDAPPDVDVYHVTPAGAAGGELWSGFVEDYQDTDGGLRLECLGAMFQVDDYTRLPLYPTEPVPWAQIFELQFQQSSRPALRVNELVVEDDPSFDTMRTGSGQDTLTGFLQDFLAVGLEEETGRKLTLALDPGRQPVLRWKDLATVHHTLDARAITAGQNVGLSLRTEMEENVIYGEGQDTAGVTWRRQRDGTGSVSYDPLALDPRADPNDAAFDPNVRRIERFINFGQGVSEARAIEIAQELVTANAEPMKVGSITVPLPYLLAEGAIPTAGQNVKVENYRGDDLLLHVTQCRIDWQSLSVSLTVDSKGRDHLTLLKILERERREQSDPGLRLRRNASSAQIEDRKLPWMTTSGYVPIGQWDPDARELVDGGVIFTPEEPGASPTEEPDAYVHCPANEWTLIEFRGATLMTVKKVKFGLYDAGGNLAPVPFYLSLLDTNDVTIGIPAEPDRDTVYLPSDPENEGEHWNHPKSAPHGELDGWGIPGQRAGYSSVPGEREGNPPEDLGGDPTGLLIDESPLSYELPEGSRACWLAVFPVGGDGFARGQFERGVE